jgi:hypothetical protein
LDIENSLFVCLQFIIIEVQLRTKFFLRSFDEKSVLCTFCFTYSFKTIWWRTVRVVENHPKIESVMKRSFPLVIVETLHRNPFRVQ